MKNIKRFIWLSLVWFFRILLSPNNMKIPFLKRIYYSINGGFTADQIALYNLNKTNKNEYLSEFDWYKSRKINGKYGKLLNDKLACNDLIKDYVLTPEVYIIKKDNNIYDVNNKNITINIALEIIKEKKSVYFKPIYAGKGIGVYKIDYKDNKFYIDYNETKEEKIKEFFETKNNYFISSAIKQAKYLDEIYDKTTNTIRLITVRENNEIKILYAVQRIGIKESIPVDNGSRGGLVSKIDLETGKLSIAKSIKNKNEYKIHPDSKNKIEGVTIPNWKKIKKDMVKVMEQLTNIKFVAWDLLVTEEGVCVIEANSSSGVNIIQIFGGQKNKDLGDFYRSNKIIK